MLRVRITAKARALVLALAGLGALLAQTHQVSAQTILHTTASLPTARSEFAATSVGDYALFGGGYCAAGVDIFNPTTGQWSSAPLSQRVYDLAATSVGNYALFGGGYRWGGGLFETNVVDIFNAGTGQWSSANLSQARRELSATSEVLPMRWTDLGPN